MLGVFRHGWPAGGDIQAFGGPRNTSPLLYTDYRYQNVGPSFYLRVRKTFGG